MEGLPAVLEVNDMDLILWRHAEAEDGTPDMARELTEKGQRQAAAMAKWLARQLPKGTRVLVSPATRTQQTAEALTRDFETIEALAPGATHTAVLSAAGWPRFEGAVLVVGHQPTLGQTAAWILSGDISEWSIKKGAAWWLTNRDRSEPHQTVLRAVMSPEFV